MISPMTRAWPTLSASQPQATVISNTIAIWVNNRVMGGVILWGTEAGQLRTTLSVYRTWDPVVLPYSGPDVRLHFGGFGLFSQAPGTTR